MLNVFMLSAVLLNVANNPFMLSVIMLNIIMLSVIILNIIMLSVVALQVRLRVYPNSRSFMVLNMGRH